MSSIFSVSQFWCCDLNRFGFHLWIFLYSIIQRLLRAPCSLSPGNLMVGTMPGLLSLGSTVSIWPWFLLRTHLTSGSGFSWFYHHQIGILCQKIDVNVTDIMSWNKSFLCWMKDDIKSDLLVFLFVYLSEIKSIKNLYPLRRKWLVDTDWWVLYFCVYAWATAEILDLKLQAFSVCVCVCLYVCNLGRPLPLIVWICNIFLPLDCITKLDNKTSQKSSIPIDVEVNKCLCKWNILKIPRN